MEKIKTDIFDESSFYGKYQNKYQNSLDIDLLKAIFHPPQFPLVAQSKNTFE